MQEEPSPQALPDPSERLARAAVRVLIGVETGKKATDLFPTALMDLDASERFELVEGIYALLRDQRRLDLAIDRIAEGGAVRPRDRARARYWAHLVRTGRGQASTANSLLPELDFVGLRSAYEAVLLDLPFETRLAVETSLPDHVVIQLLADYGPVEGEALLRSLAEAPPFCIRANPLLTTREALAERLRAGGIESTPTPRASHGLILDHRRNVWGLPAFQEGAFEVQDEGSQLIAELVAPPPKGLVIDVCAGAGGKSLALGALLGGKGRLLSADVPSAKKRLEELARRARRAQLSNVQIVETPATGDWPGQVALHLGKADRVLVDAPCSGTGVLRRNPEARLALSEEKVGRLVELQLRILERALPLVHPKGRLIYATCSVLKAENEGVTERFLEAHPELERVSAKEILGKARAEAIGDGEVLRLWPHRHGTDGFYAVVLRRRRPAS